NGSSYTTEFRQYDPRLMRWKSVDPLMAMFPWMSPYVAFDNNPVYYKDPLGLAAEGGSGKRKQAKADAEEALEVFTEGADVKGNVKYSINDDNSVSYRYKTNSGERVKGTIHNAVNSAGGKATRTKYDEVAAARKTGGKIELNLDRSNFTSLVVDKPFSLKPKSGEIGNGIKKQLRISV